MTDVRERAGDPVIARLRQAPDELAAEVEADVEAHVKAQVNAGDAAARAQRPAPAGRSARSGAPHRARWLGVAAASMLLVGAAVWALSMRQEAADAPASAPSTAITAPTVAPAGEAAWFELTAAGFEPQRVGDPVTSTSFGAVWTAIEPGARPRLLLLRVVAAADVAHPTTTLGELHDFTERRQPDGSIWKFSATGFTFAEANALAAQVVPGSGLPFVLADPSVRLLAYATPGEVRGRGQEYAGALGSVLLQVGGYSDQFDGFVDAVTTRAVAVAGLDGYAVERPDGSTTVVWPAADGGWAWMSTPAGSAHQVDEIIASVVAAAPPG